MPEIRGRAVPPVWAEGAPHPCPIDEVGRGGASEEGGVRGFRGKAAEFEGRRVGTDVCRDKEVKCSR